MSKVVLIIAGLIFTFITINTIGINRKWIPNVRESFKLLGAHFFRVGNKEYVLIFLWEIYQV